jgi:hypothetical protein
MPIIEDFLASFCFASEGNPPAEIGNLAAFADDLDKRFRYWEIVYVVRERFRGIGSFSQLLAKTKNLRIIVVADGVNYYRRRALAASEAIGDIVVLTSFTELGMVDLPACAEDAYATGEIVLCCTKIGAAPVLSVHWVLTALTSHNVNPHDLKTIALPRARLNGMIPRSTLALDLRFQPKEGAECYRRRVVRIERRGPRRSLPGRRELIEQLILTSAPRLLRLYAATAGVVTLLSLIYALYAVANLLFNPHLQKGWFSTAIVQSGSEGFIAIGMTVIAFGLAGIAERLAGRSRSEILDEIANISFFERTKAANVEQTESGRWQRVGTE